MPDSDQTYVDHVGMAALSASLAAGATVLDGIGAGAPAAPDAGVSTPLVGDLLAGMSGAVSDLVTTVDVTANSVRTSDDTLGSADSGGARHFGALGE